MKRAFLVEVILKHDRDRHPYTIVKDDKSEEAIPSSH